MGKKLIESTAKGQLMNSAQLFDDEGIYVLYDSSPIDIVRLKNRIYAMNVRKTLPPVVTHNMANDNDEILDKIRNCGLFNNRHDRVKIIYHPGEFSSKFHSFLEFLSTLSPLLPMGYNEFVRGCHLGVFPS